MYEIPVPGIPTVPLVPFELMLTDEPDFPTVILDSPFLLRLIFIPGHIFMDFFTLKNPIFTSHFYFHHI